MTTVSEAVAELEADAEESMRGFFESQRKVEALILLAHRHGIPEAEIAAALGHVANG